MQNTVLYVVIPCYNEEEVLPETIRRMGQLFDTMTAEGQIAPQSRIVFVDDGSKDATWQLISVASQRDERLRGIKLSKNAGHQNALLAGLMAVKESCDCCISIDADLQDDIGAIPKFVTEFDRGCDVVYGVRSRRDTDSGFKRISAKVFYQLMRILGADVIDNHADYRLMSRRALAALAEFPEVNLFLRGVVRLVGFPSGTVYYERTERFAGKSKYPLRKMLSFAFDGITSFSIKPIRLVWGLGLLACLMAVAAAAYSLVSWFFGNSVTGWTSLMISIWFLGGVQLVSVGVIGEYIGKIYKEVKRRPRYIIEETNIEN
ncbi:MAG: glycosyltransferase family 2 protein [Clostridia bacterium]|nr:glycosyltransferase family 2 protein [Clostridia bacterium]